MKLAQLSDIHLGSALQPVAGLTSAQRRGRLLRTFEESIAFLAEQQVEVALLPGDLFDSNQVQPGTVKAVVQALERAPEIQFFIAPGNHDYLCPRSPYVYERWPDNVHIFREPTVTYVDVDSLNLRVYGRAGLRYEPDSHVLEGFRAEETGRLKLMVLHGLVAGGAAEDYCPVTTAQIAASNLDYLALGHVHTAGGIQTAGRTSYAYSGVLEGRGFDETGEKGLLLGDLERGSVSLRLVPRGRTRFEWVRADLTGCTGMTDLLACLEQATAAVPDGAVLRITLNGTGAFSLEFEPQALAGEFSQNGRFAEVQIRDESLRLPDLEQLAAEQSLTGFFAKRMLERLETAEDRDQVLEACRLGLLALEGRSVTPDGI